MYSGLRAVLGRLHEQPDEGLEGEVDEGALSEGHVAVSLRVDHARLDHVHRNVGAWVGKARGKRGK